MARKRHELKTTPDSFQELWSEHRKFDVRKDDRGFQPGDMILFREYDLRTMKYSGRQISAMVEYLFDLGCPLTNLNGFVVLQISTISKQELDPEVVKELNRFGIGAFVYCNQHMRPHLTGWCGVSVDNKIKLLATDRDTAYSECRSKGYALYGETENTK